MKALGRDYGHFRMTQEQRSLMETLRELGAEKGTGCPCVQSGILTSGRTDREWEGLSTPHLTTLLQGVCGLS